MAWTPENAIITARAIPDNLLTYVTDADRQGDALTWADGPGLKLIKTFSIRNAAKENPSFPLILYVEDDDAQELGGDIIDGAYTVTLALQIQNTDPDELVTQSRKYASAFCSMIANIPQATLVAGTGATVAVLIKIITGFGAIRKKEKVNDFLQIIQIRAAYLLTAGS